MDDIRVPVKQNSPRLLDQIRIMMRERNYAFSTEKTYIFWILRFIRYHNTLHPKDMGKQEVESFLSFLGNERHYSKSFSTNRIKRTNFSLSRISRKRLR